MAEILFLWKYVYRHLFPINFIPDKPTPILRLKERTQITHDINHLLME